MEITPEGKIGIGLALLSLLGAGAITIVPDTVWIDWAVKTELLTHLRHWPISVFRLITSISRPRSLFGKCWCVVEFKLGSGAGLKAKGSWAEGERKIGQHHCCCLRCMPSNYRTSSALIPCHATVGRLLICRPRFELRDRDRRRFMDKAAVLLRTVHAYAGRLAARFIRTNDPLTSRTRVER